MTTQLERIGDFMVHPVASMFPMAGPKEERELCDSITVIGLQEPVVMHEGLLVDGRNRAMACIKCQVPIRTVEWSTLVAHHHLRAESPRDYQPTTVDQWIMAKNVARRNLTPDQIATVWAQHSVWAEEQDAAERKARAQFKGGENPNGRRGKEPVNTKPYEPVPSKDYNQTSTIGKVASAANVSHHKAAQAIKLVKAVESGDAPKEDLEKVKAGLKKLREATKPMEKLAAERPPIEERVKADFRRLLDRYAVAEHAKVKEIIKELL